MSKTGEESTLCLDEKDYDTVTESYQDFKMSNHVVAWATKASTQMLHQK